MLRGRQTITSGTLGLRGVQRRVTIRRDGYGIPHIDAETDLDATYALGFCQGQDRSFQIELMVRVVRGTVSELLGNDGVAVDRLSRRIGFHRAAVEQLGLLETEARGLLDAFARGVTDGASAGRRVRELAFILLRGRPSRMQAEDVLGVMKLMSFTLSSNWDAELARLKILLEDGPDAVAALNFTYPSWLQVTLPPGTAAGAALDRLAEELSALTAIAGQGGGSNAWAVAGSRSATGKPILANDTHLAPTLPPHWYLAHVRAPGWTVAGATLAGSPGFATAHNGFAAWGVTAGLVDNTDLFLEDIGPDGRSVRQGEEFVPCEVRRETIHVRGREPVIEEVLITPRGPVVSPALEGGMPALSMSAVWLERRPIRGLLEAHRARSPEAFRECFSAWPGLPLNLIYADDAGAILWQLVGEAPRRRRGHGLMPSPGWDVRFGWEDSGVPFGEMPHAVNPDAGFVASANNQPLPSGCPPFLGDDWLDGYRVTRISEVIEGRNDWNREGFMALQMDQVSLPWRELRDVVLGIDPPDDAARQGLEILRTWDGVVGENSIGATVFETFVQEIVARLVGSAAPRSAAWAMGRGFTPLVPHSITALRRMSHLVTLLREKPGGRFGPRTGDWSDMIGGSISAAVVRLRHRFGDEPASWQWGAVRPLVLRHLLGRRPPLDHLYNLGPFPIGGDTNTVAQASVSYSAAEAGLLFTASARMVVEIGSWDDSRFSLPGGQSGDPLSRHYEDLLPFWLRGDGVPIAWSEEAVNRAAVEVLCLEPEV